MQSARRQLLLQSFTALAGSLVGCAAVAVAPRTWPDLNLPGTVLTLESQSEVEELRFLGEANGGWVVATIGSKNGPLTGPVFPWRIDGEILVIGHDKEFERLEFIGLEQGRVVARRSTGQVVKFRRVKS